MLLCVHVCVLLCGRTILNTCQRGTNSKASIHAVQQRHSNSSGITQVNLATLTYIGTLVCFQPVTPPGFHVIHIPTGNLALLCIKSSFFTGRQNFSLPVAGLLSRSRLRGTQGTRLHTTVLLWVLAGLHGACSGRSKSRSLASDHGVAFREARVEQDNEKPNMLRSFFAFVSAPLLYSHAATV